LDAGESFFVNTISGAPRPKSLASPRLPTLSVAIHLENLEIRISAEGRTTPMKTTLGFLTEEGRTRRKNAARRICVYATLMFLVAGASGYGIHRYWVSAE